MSEPSNSNPPSRKRSRVDSESIDGPDAKKSRDLSSTDLLKATKKKRSKGSKRKRKASITAIVPIKTEHATSSKPLTHVKDLADGDNSDEEGASTNHKEPDVGTSGTDQMHVKHDLPPQLSIKDQDLKGKGKDDSQTSLDGLEKDTKSRITTLENQLEEKSQLLSRYQDALQYTQSNITCQICLDLMYKPFALAPCGHLVCYGCLVAWFKAPPSNDQGFVPPVLLRRKTCPHCRAIVRERPAEVWDVKNIVVTLSKSGLLNTVEGGQDTANDPIPADPWEGIFKPVPTHGPQGHGLFQHFLQGVARDFMPAPPAPGAGGPDMGMYDAEDGGVYRCLDCMHEIFRGRCTSCNRTYPGHRDFDEEEDEDYEDMPYDLEMDASDLSEFEEAMMAGWHYPIYGDIDDEDDEDEDRESDEDNEYDVHDPFIDDIGLLPIFQVHDLEDDDDGSTEGLADTESDGGSPSGAFIVELDSDGNEIHKEEDHVEEDKNAQNERSENDEDDTNEPRRTRSRRPVAIISEDEEEEDISFAPQRRKRAFRSRNLMSSSDEEDVDAEDVYEDDGSIPGPASHLRHYLDDEDDEDDDGNSLGSQSEEEEHEFLAH